jgi:D-serine dehydratase
MKDCQTPQDFANVERQLLTEYTVACLFDMGMSIQLCEAELAPNITVHFAIAADSTTLSADRLDQLGEQGVKLRDEFLKKLPEGLSTKEAAIAVQLIQGENLSIGIIKLPQEKRLELLSNTGLTPMELVI